MSDEFQPDPSRVLRIVQAIAAEAHALVPPPTPEPAEGYEAAFDQRITDPGLRVVTRSRFMSKHYADAVEAGVKYLIQIVHEKSGKEPDADGTGLMTSVFSEKKPVLRVNEGRTKSDKSEQLGYMHLFAGVVAAFRNPRAHRADIEDSPEGALLMLEFANHLATVVHASKKTRRRRTDERSQ